MLGWTIREAVPSDYEVLCEIIAEVDTLHLEALPQLFRRTEGPPRDQAYLYQLMTHPDAAFLVAERTDDRSGQLLGFVNAWLRQARDIPILRPRRYVEIENLAVCPSARRLGIGRALMEAVFAWARGRGAQQIELTVWEFNAGARAFYEALGYTTASRRMWRTLEA
jgi:ribosomal protein S18 acetylase RimI-like enzyme